MRMIGIWTNKLIPVFSFSGMHFSQAVAIIQSQVGVIKGVQVLYSETVNAMQTNIDCYICTSQQSQIFAESAGRWYCDKSTIRWN